MVSKKLISQKNPLDEMMPTVNNKTGSVVDTIRTVSYKYRRR